MRESCTWTDVSAEDGPRVTPDAPEGVIDCRGCRLLTERTNGRTPPGASDCRTGSNLLRMSDEVRASVYEILARLYQSAVTPECLEELERVGFLAAMADACARLSVPAPSDALDCDALRAEFTRLFHGPGAHVPPYASVHRTDDARRGQLWGTKTGEVKLFMAHYGLPPTGSPAIPDHLAVLFEFMARGIRAELNGGRAIRRHTDRITLQIQREFLRRYIEPWVERFLASVRAAQPAPFYEALVTLTTEFLAREGRLFANHGPATGHRVPVHDLRGHAAQSPQPLHWEG